MIEEIHRLLALVPFLPFVIVTSAGKEYPVASVDHIGFSPSGKQIVVWHDDDTCSFLSPLHIAALEKLSSASQAA